MASSVARKLGLREGQRAFFVDAPPGAIDAIDPPPLEIAGKLTGDLDYIHLFAKRQAKLNAEFPKLARHLKATGALWVSWPKSGQLETDLRLPVVIKIGYDHGLVESKTISIDSTWSAIKFTHPKQGKEYKNSYGKLKATSDK